MESGIAAILSKLGAWLYALFPAAAGSAFSIFSDKKDMAAISRFAILSTFLFGVIIGHGFGGAINEHFKLLADSLMAFSIKFTVGWMGMATLVGIKLQITPAIVALRKKYFGE